MNVAEIARSSSFGAFGAINRHGFFRGDSESDGLEAQKTIVLMSFDKIGRSSSFWAFDAINRHVFFSWKFRI